MRLPCVRWQNRVETYSELCHLLPDYDTITVVLIGPRMLDSQHGKEGKATGLRDGDNMKSGTCTIIVQGFKGIYSAEVLERWPASPDIIIGFDVDLYTCSWRPTLLYLLHVSQVRGPKIVFTFFMVHEPVYGSSCSPSRSSPSARSCGRTARTRLTRSTGRQSGARRSTPARRC